MAKGNAFLLGMDRDMSVWSQWVITEIQLLFTPTNPLAEWSCAQQVGPAAACSHKEPPFALKWRLSDFRKSNIAQIAAVNKPFAEYHRNTPDSLVGLVAMS